MPGHGTITVCMNEPTARPAITPPRMVHAITAGFNLVANHIYIILAPLALDLFLWFGPHLRIKAIMEPVVQDMLRQLSTFYQGQLEANAEVIREFYLGVLQQFNLFTFLRSYPVGVFSLFSSSSPTEHPLVLPLFIEVPTMGLAFLYVLILTLAGLFIGTLFFREMARFTGESLVDHKLRPVLWHYGQTVLLTLILLLLVLLIVVPLTLAFSFLTLFSPVIAQIVLFMIIVFVLWLVVPMVFAPHGIYFSQQHAMSALLTSVRMVRFHLPGTSIFLMVVILLGEGLKIIWRFAPASSWMALVGVLGNAFVSTALLAATYIYYRDGLIWMKSRQHNLASASAGSNGRIL